MKMDGLYPAVFQNLGCNQWRCRLNLPGFYSPATLPGGLTPIETIDAYAKENGYSRKQSSEITETLLEIIKQSLKSGEDVMISGFGKFEAKSKKERRGRNRATEEDLMLAPRRVVTFKCSNKLSDRINK